MFSSLLLTSTSYIQLGSSSGLDIIKSPPAAIPVRYVPYECDIKMTELIKTIDDIVKFGLQPNLSVPDRDKVLEQGLLKIYSFYFDISYQFDDIDFPDFDKSDLPDIRTQCKNQFY